MDREAQESVRAAVLNEMRCPTCNRQRVTTQQLAQDAGLALRTVSRFVNGVNVNGETLGKLREWLGHRGQ